MSIEWRLFHSKKSLINDINGLEIELATANRTIEAQAKRLEKAEGLLDECRLVVPARREEGSLFQMIGRFLTSTPGTPTTEPEMVMVRREDLEDILANPDWDKKDELYSRLKAALDREKEMKL